MLIIKPITLDLLPIIRKAFESLSANICDRTVGCLYMWKDYFENSVAMVDDSIILVATIPSNPIRCFSFPIGGDTDKALYELEQYLQRRNLPLCFFPITETELDYLQQRYKRIEIDANPSWFDYCYSASEFYNFSGNKYKKKRNHLHQFMRSYPSYKVEKIGEDNLEEALRFIKTFNYQDVVLDENALAELQLTYQFMKDYALYDQIGVLLKVEEKVIGLIEGEILGNMIFIHIEKADIQYVGSYQMLINEFLKMYYRPEILYVNREEDMGDSGLKKSKSSYHPIEKIRKYTVWVK